MKLVEAVYATTSRFPGDERFGLTSQLRRASVSVPSNIAEGQGRATNGEFTNALSAANGSLREIETQVMIARRLRYIDENTETNLLEQAAEVGRLMNGLRNSLKKQR